MIAGPQGGVDPAAYPQGGYDANGNAVDNRATQTNNRGEYWLTWLTIWTTPKIIVAVLPLW